MSTAVIRPTIPYHGPVIGGLHEGNTIEIRGQVPFGADTFSVNIVAGHNVKADRPLHISVRFRKREVVRNSMKMNVWGSEEKKGDLFPFFQGQEFTMSIAITSVCFFISVNGRHCWKFVHRLPTFPESSVLIEGHVVIDRIDFINNNPRPHVQPATVQICPAPKVYPGTQSYPTPANLSFPTPAVCPGTQSYPTPANRSFPTPAVCPGTQSYPTPAVCPGTQSYPTPGTPAYPQVCPTSSIYPPISSRYEVVGEFSNPPFVTPNQVITPPENRCRYPTGDFLDLQTIHNPKIPFSCPIPGGLRPGMMIYITGRPNAYPPHDFNINLQQSAASYPPPNVAFHFSVRFHNRTVVRNTRINGTWEWEESSTPHFPFHPGKEFLLHILVEYDKYMVAVDNQHFVEFRHRLQPLEQFAAALHIEQGCLISSIKFA